jgi:hypothetical protein
MGQSGGYLRGSFGHVSREPVYQGLRGQYVEFGGGTGASMRGNHVASEGGEGHDEENMKGGGVRGGL